MSFLWGFGSSEREFTTHLIDLRKAAQLWIEPHLLISSQTYSSHRWVRNATMTFPIFIKRKLIMFIKIVNERLGKEVDKKCSSQVSFRCVWICSKFFQTNWRYWKGQRGECYEFYSNHRLGVRKSRKEFCFNSIVIKHVFYFYIVFFKLHHHSSCFKVVLYERCCYAMLEITTELSEPS